MVIGIFIACALFGTLVQSCNSTVPTSTATPANQQSFEHRYATERFKAEGYNSTDAQQAADAVTKFLRAQEAQRNSR